MQENKNPPVPVCKPGASSLDIPLSSRSALPSDFFLLPEVRKLTGSLVAAGRGTHVLLEDLDEVALRTERQQVADLQRRVLREAEQIGSGFNLLLVPT